MSAQSAQPAQAAVTRWNEQYPVGTAVTLTNGLGVATQTVTTSPAMLFAKSEPVIYVRGQVGFFSLSRLAVLSAIEDDKELCIS